MIPGFSYGTLFAIACILIFIAAVVYAIIKKQVKWIIGLGLFLLIISGTFLFHLFSDTESGFSYDKIKDFNPNQTLIIENHLLTYEEDHSTIIFLNSSKKEVPVTYYPIYLNELDAYYIVVFSKDTSNSLTDGLFFQHDYEMYRNQVDMLLLISKVDGQLLQPRVYNLIGSTVDLDAAENKEDTITFPVYKPFSKNINYYYYIEQLPTNSRPYITSDMISFSGDKNIEKFEFVQGRYLTLFDTGDISYYIRSPYIIEESDVITSIRFSANYSQILNDEIYVKQGYFTTHNNQIYIVGNDLCIYLVTGETLTKVKQLESLDTWMDEISALI